MPRGGRRRGAGRKPGTQSKKLRKVAELIVAEGDTPLDILMKVARNPEVDLQLRVEASGRAAPFVHPRLAMVSATIDATVTEGARVDQVMIVQPVQSGCFISPYGAILDQEEAARSWAAYRATNHKSTLFAPKLVISNDDPVPGNDGAPAA